MHATQRGFLFRSVLSVSFTCDCEKKLEIALTGVYEHLKTIRFRQVASFFKTEFHNDWSLVNSI